MEKENEWVTEEKEEEEEEEMRMVFFSVSEGT